MRLHHPRDRFRFQHALLRPGPQAEQEFHEIRCRAHHAAAARRIALPFPDMVVVEVQDAAAGVQRVLCLHADGRAAAGRGACRLCMIVIMPAVATVRVAVAGLCVAIATVCVAATGVRAVAAGGGCRGTVLCRCILVGHGQPIRVGHGKAGVLHAQRACHGFTYDVGQ